MSVNDSIQAVYVPHHILGQCGLLCSQINSNWGFMFSYSHASSCLHV